ncbi:uncharacterized protein LOC117816511 [Notolabrus celidotus]|uniref:uncharacterized protein LOC117816511 n=1 Tax=Notolabrus celidotus TaxID=1203425 RepID=UPI00148FF1FC|nr:uncharacterized protein LOC117816511 [Notolabrus celidotus]
MMRFIHVSMAVFSLLSVVQTASVNNCKILTQPVEIQGRDQMLGKWMLLAEATNNPGAELITKLLVESSWTKFAAANESDAIDVFEAEKMLGHCFTLKTKITLENRTLSIGPPMNSSARLLTTGCPDCLIYYVQYLMEGSTYGGLQLMSKRNNVTTAELEEFKKQVECLNLPPPMILSQEKGLCPEESPLSTDLTMDINNMTPEILEKIEKMISSAGSMDMLFRFISSLGNLADY